MADTAKLRQENLNVIRRILLAEQGFTKQEIAGALELSLPTVSNLQYASECAGPARGGTKRTETDRQRGALLRRLPDQ